MNLAFASSKGGVGKSTSCASIAAFLASRGESVLVFDLDPNQTLGRWKDKTDLPTLTVMPVTLDDFGKAYRNPDIVGGHDHILMDLAGARAHKAMNVAFARSHLVIIPAQHSEPDLIEAMNIIDDVAEAEAEYDRAIPYRVLFNRVRPLGSHADKFIMDQVREHNVDCFKTQFVDRVAYRETFLNGTPPHIRDGEKGAGAEIPAVVQEIEELLAVANHDRRASA